MAIIQQKERELRYAKQGNLQQEAAVSSNYMRDMIRAYGLDLHYYKLKCPYPEIFKPILDMNKLTMHAYGYDPTPEYEVETPIIAYWQFSDDTLILNQYGVQPNRVAKCWIDATDFAIAFAKKLSEYKEYKVDSDVDIELEFDSILDFTESVNSLKINFNTDLFSGECAPVLTKSQIDYIVKLVTEGSGGIIVDRPSNINQAIDVIMELVSRINTIKLPVITENGEVTPVTYTDNVPCVVKTRNELHLETPHVVPEFWKGKQYEDFIDDCWDSYIRMRIDGLDVNRDGSFKMRVHLTGAIIYYDLHVISKYWQQIKPDVGDVVSIPIYNQGDTVSRFEIVHIQGSKYNETYQNPFLRNYIYECDLRAYVSSGEKVPEERESEKQYRKLDELINFASSEAGRKMSLYKDHEDNIYGGYDKVGGLDGAILAANEKKGVTINSFENRENKGVPPDVISKEQLLGGQLDLLHIADISYPTNLSLMIVTNHEEDWSKLVLTKTSDVSADLSTEPWQHYLRCNDDTLIFRLDNHIYRLASMIEPCQMYENSPTIMPRRLKRNVYAQRGGFNDQPFNLVDSEESQLDLGNYAETLTGPKAGEEYKGQQIKNADLSRMIWRNTRSYMDVVLTKNEETGKEYYELAVKFKGDRRNRRFPIAVCDA